jgi:hypothetical protein
MDFHTKNIHQGRFNEVLKKIFGLRTEEVRNKLRKLHSEDRLHL